MQMEITGAHIEGLMKGNRDSYLFLYKNFFVALCIFARGFSIGREDSEDIVQEVFCRMYDERRLFENISSLKSYLYKAVKNESLNYIRSEKRRKDRESHYYDEEDDECAYFNEIIENEVYRKLKILLDELPPRCKLIFERTLQGETSEEIAEALQLSIETVKTQRKKAKQILRDRYNLLFQVFGVLF